MSIKKRLSCAVNEKDVESIYRDELNKHIKESVITSPYGVDGLIQSDSLRTLLEFKYQENFKQKLSQCNVLIQCLYYLKKFEAKGEKIPSSIFVGDINECFALDARAIVKYLNKPIDWKIAPSEASRHNNELIQAMVEDEDILPFVFDIDDKFHILDAIRKIKSISDNIVYKCKVNKTNLELAFEYFRDNVAIYKTELSTNELANLFVQLLINPSDNYLHPNKKKCLVTKHWGEVRINCTLFRSFFSHFEGNDYTPQEKEEMASLVDRLVEDVSRRRRGEFFTPTGITETMFKYIADVFGEDWAEEYVVWDPCWGTGNLTRDKKFANLYCSTIDGSDIHTANEMGFNNEATKFVYDFLNDGLDENGGVDMGNDNKMPDGLKQAISDGKKIIVLMNPPYAMAGNFGTGSTHKAGVGKNKINTYMVKNKWGKSAQATYAQFLCRCWQYQQLNKNVNIVCFSTPVYLSGGSFNNFREKFFNGFEYEKGFLFPASCFDNVSNNWGVALSIFSSRENKELNSDKYEFIHDRIEMDKDSFQFYQSGVKNIYNLDNGYKCSDWIREEVKGLKTYDGPQMSSYYGIKEKGCGSKVEDKLFLGYFYNIANNVYKSPTTVALFSGICSDGHGFSIIKENFLKCTSLFTARKLIKREWDNFQDEYTKPNEGHSNYDQFVVDSIIYSLFDSKSQQSSLREVTYKDEKYDIKNEFFWMSWQKIQELANKNNYDELHRDTKGQSNRHVYELLFGEERLVDKLSDDARILLEKASDLVEKSMAMRKIMDWECPEYHLASWDAGYAQLKNVWQKYFPEEFKDFRNSYNKFAERLRPQVYTLGFLK